MKIFYKNTINYAKVKYFEQENNPHTYCAGVTVVRVA
jgi:hypothetical protein